MRAVKGWSWICIFKKVQEPFVILAAELRGLIIKS
jgi:hypothetical protein